MVERVQDGFDAIEYPIDFSFKAVCEKLNELSSDQLQQIVQQAIRQELGEAAVKGASCKESSTGRYVSVTVLARLENRGQLESVYSVLSGLDVVKMTL
ncbi:MAG: DUF493 domain-containing protein [Arenicella sp.]